MKKWMFFLLPMLVWAQDYYEASGKTSAFTLTAGAKGIWDNPVTISEKTELVVDYSVSMTISPNPSTGKIRFNVTNNNGAAMVTVYNIAGEKIQNLILNDRREKVLNNDLPNGIYFAQLNVCGKMVQTSRFLLVR